MLPNRPNLRTLKLFLNRIAPGRARNQLRRRRANGKSLVGDLDEPYIRAQRDAEHPLLEDVAGGVEVGHLQLRSSAAHEGPGGHLHRAEIFHRHDELHPGCSGKIPAALDRRRPGNAVSLHQGRQEHARGVASHKVVLKIVPSADVDAHRGVRAVVIGMDDVSRAVARGEGVDHVSVEDHGGIDGLDKARHRALGIGALQVVDVAGLDGKKHRGKAHGI